MNILFIGGTGLISSACSDLALRQGHQLTLLNRSRSTKYPLPEGARLIQADVRGEESGLAALLAKEKFDAVVDWIAFTRADIERDLRLFNGKTGHFVFISSASAYQKPPAHYIITESSPLENPFWEYSRNKIICENLLMDAWRKEGFPATIVRPSLTYGPSQIPLAGASWQHPYTAIDRMRKGLKVVVPGDGTSLWTVTWNGDFAVGFNGLLGNPKTHGEAFHITSDEVLSWNQIYATAAREAGAEFLPAHISSDVIAAFNPGAVGDLIGDKNNSSVFDNSKIKRFVPQFKCKVSWQEGVRRSLAWFDADPARRTIDSELNDLWDRLIALQESILP